jgi:hypothetical protein
MPMRETSPSTTQMEKDYLRSPRTVDLTDHEAISRGRDSETTAPAPVKTSQAFSPPDRTE